jgi:hypothetical protein
MAEKDKSESLWKKLGEHALKVAVGAIVLAVLAYLQAEAEAAAQNEPVQFFLYGVAATLLVLAVSLVVFGSLQRRRARKLASIPAPLTPTPPPETVPQEGVERLRELYASWGPTVQLAHECLHIHICSVGEKGSQDQRRIAWLVQNYIVRPCSDDKYLLDVKFQSISGPTTKTAFAELIELLSQVINNRYRETAFWILQAGESILGKESLLLSSWYATLYERHQEGLREFSRIHARPDIGGISSWQRTLGELLPSPTKEPSEDPPPSTAS